MTKTSDKDKILEQVLIDIEKQFGKGSIMKLGDKTKYKIEASPSGSLALDIILGVGDILKEELSKYLGLNLVVKQP